MHCLEPTAIRRWENGAAHSKHDLFNMLGLKGSPNVNTSTQMAIMLGKHSCRRTWHTAARAACERMSGAFKWHFPDLELHWARPKHHQRCRMGKRSWSHLYIRGGRVWKAVRLMMQIICDVWFQSISWEGQGLMMPGCRAITLCHCDLHMSKTKALPKDELLMKSQPRKMWQRSMTSIIQSSVLSNIISELNDWGHRTQIWFRKVCKLNDPGHPEIHRMGPLTHPQIIWME